MSSNSDASQERERSDSPPEGHTVGRSNSDSSRIARQEGEGSNSSLENHTNGLPIDDRSLNTSQDDQLSYGFSERSTNEQLISDLITLQAVEQSDGPLEDNVNGLSIDDTGLTASQENEQSDGPLENNANWLAITDLILTARQEGEQNDGPRGDNTNGLSISDSSLDTSQEGEQSDGPPEDNTNGLSTSDPSLTTSQQGGRSDRPTENNTNERPIIHQGWVTRQGRLRRIQRTNSDWCRIACQGRERSYYPRGERTITRLRSYYPRGGRTIRRSRSVPSKTTSQDSERSDYPIRRCIISCDPLLIPPLWQTIGELVSLSLVLRHHRTLSKPHPPQNFRIKTPPTHSLSRRIQWKAL